jgi:hypothetical protein
MGFPALPRSAGSALELTAIVESLNWSEGKIFKHPVKDKHIVVC